MSSTRVAKLIGTLSVCLLGVMELSGTPVTISYDVTLTQQCFRNDYTTGDPVSTQFTCSAVSDQFQLSLTYDDGVTGTTNLAARKDVRLGMPGFTFTGFTYSPVVNPLGAPTVSGEVIAENVEGATFHNERVSAHVSETAHGGAGETWGTVVQIYALDSSPGPQDSVVDMPTAADAALRLQGGITPLFFLYSAAYWERTCLNANCTSSFFDYSPESYSVTGTAVLQTNTVPEPAGLSLLGSGLLGLAAMIRKLRGRAEATT